ncbi:small metal-binding protein SmbP [Methylomonas rivi]|uniref:Small metal-binding protein n=1 Tax=Methylomonas rivi TaxID=2952226 RepID=A0ABT1U1G7_9GAMM|nr:small metal-binding protein SmbP [Methylomonas sp. WSC-6]MCQ8127667.1 hypothetical protein [Methylomonas sp. WSC-6]
MMKSRHPIAALLFFILSSAVQAAGSPMNEDFTNLISLSKNAIEAGKQEDAQAFAEKTNIAMEALKAQAQNEKGYSIKLPRASAKLKAALKAAKAGNIQEGIDNLELAVTEMQKK